MADGTHIEWTDATWNPITGCSIVSPGCTNCYAMKLAGTRLQHHPSRAGLTIDSKSGPVWNGQLRFNEQWLDQPLRWRKPRRIFVCAHGDLFAEGVPDEWIDRVFAIMALAPQHTFQVLTKRALRMREYLQDELWRGRRIAGQVIDVAIAHKTVMSRMVRTIDDTWPVVSIGDPEWPDDIKIRHWPLPNVWLGVSAEDQMRADERVPELLETPAAIRFASAEPLLGPIEFRDILDGINSLSHRSRSTLDWIIVGGESGANARPTNSEWVRAIRDQCARSGTAFFFKQWGNWLPSGQLAADGRPWSPLSGNNLHAIKAITGRLLDGVEHNAMPQVQP